ncbi:Hypothetical protein NGAL_HAMBI1145_39470 [Neorhizobium galegae bv. officinalis]|uniref:Uncharacterized protein n=1 Tax=Neorhizobium galegae bv. officinalis TaxID=323656 RepID=A0A0T7FRF4_NEOGA|nr:Hypothetical protein NGAL_HAMBI1145_39470 [Neorhizobium galegae bv. officinalis]
MNVWPEQASPEYYQHDLPIHRHSQAEWHSPRKQSGNWQHQNHLEYIADGMEMEG